MLLLQKCQRPLREQAHAKKQRRKLSRISLVEGMAGVVPIDLAHQDARLLTLSTCCFWDVCIQLFKVQDRRCIRGFSSANSPMPPA